LFCLNGRTANSLESKKKMQKLEFVQAIKILQKFNLTFKS